MSAPTIGSLIEAVESRLELRWIAGVEGTERTLSDPDDKAEHALVGPLNFIHPNRIQLIGPAELTYLDQLKDTTRLDTIRQLLLTEPAAIVCTDDIEVPEDLITAADAIDIPLLSTAIDDQRVHSSMLYYLSLLLAERDTIHGVFMEVHGTGVLLTGTAAAGKSELALELVTRGHRLIADDAPEFARIAPDIVSGSCPPLLEDFIEVRGLGLLNVRHMFGDTAIVRKKALRLIIHLAQLDDESLAKMDRLTGTYSYRMVLGLEIPQVTVPVAPGRNMAILVETAVRNHMLRLQGYDASEDFIDRQRQAIQNDSD